MLVELKNGETLNGHLVTCDTWMNLTLKEVVQTSPVEFTLISYWAFKKNSCNGVTTPVKQPERFLGSNADGTLQDGDRFFRLPEVYVKGNNVGILHCHGSDWALMV